MQGYGDLDLSSIAIIKHIDPRSNKDRFIYLILICVWITLNWFLWSWWFKIEHVGNITLFTFMSLALLYDVGILPSFYLFFLGRMKKPFVTRPVKNLKVAIISLCVPSKENISIIERQLRAMVAVEYPHDSWILDEENNPQVKRLAEQIGVKYFTREGDKKFNQDKPPFQKKTKSGNVNAWLNTHGEKYTYFTQLDIDHCPKPNYLNRVLGFLRNPRIAWVQAPSVYGNLQSSWCSRGSAEQELVLQGPLQMGFYGFSKTPFIIGSHTTYRTSAVLEINGFQPTRAEDHLDTVVLASRGYKGVFLPEIIAVGNGPETFESYLSQQFAWAYSMMQVLFYHTPKRIFKFTLRQIIQFLFSETWYILWSTSMATLFLLPAIALFLNTPISHVRFFDTFIHFTPVFLTSIFTFFWSSKWFQPQGLHLSWRGIVLHIARWPIVFWALLNVLMEVKKPYMVTSKGIERGVRKPFRMTSFLPYVGLMLLTLLSSWFYIVHWKESSAQGHLIFTIQNCIVLITIFAVVLFNDMKEMAAVKVKIHQILRLRLFPLLLTFTGIIIILFTAWLSSPKIGEAVYWGGVQNTILFEDGKTYIGAYDPEELLNPKEIEHYFIDWRKTGEISKAIVNARMRNRLPMITLEPWPTKEEDVILAINQGKYNKTIENAAKIIANEKPQIVIIRWAHEMELDDIYPWSGADPQSYITAYRKVKDIFKKEGANNVIWLWSPAGEYNAIFYYPGDEYIDIVGVTILSDPTWDESILGIKNPTFEQYLKRRAWVGNYFNKPIVVSEAGISNPDPEAKKQWLTEAKSVISNSPNIRAIVYFNDTNLHTVDTNEYFPDWRIDPEIWEGVWK